MKHILLIIFLISTTLLFPQIDSTFFKDTSIDTLDSSSYSVTSLEGTATPSFAIMMGKMIFSLIIISLILYIALRLFKSLNRGLSLKSKNNIKVIETQPLAYKQLVQLVLISKKLYIIASNQNTIKVIDIIENQEEIEEITNQKPQQENSIFISLYAKHLKKKGKNEH